MTNMRLIEDAVNLVIEYNEAEQIYETTEVIKARAMEWYNKTEIVDTEMLAAAVLTGDFDPGMTWREIEEARAFYFPCEPIELCNYHIGEIEASLYDAMWR